MSTQGPKEVRLEAQAKLRVFPVTDLARPCGSKVPQKEGGKRGGEPKGTNSDGEETHHLHLNRDQQESKVTFLKIFYFAAAAAADALCYIKILGGKG